MRTTTKLLFVVSMLLVPCLSGAEVLRVTAERVSVRNQPSTSGAVVTIVSRGTLLDVVEKDGYWNRVRVQSTGETGYIHSAFVEVVTTQSAESSRAVRNPSPPSQPTQTAERTNSSRSQPRRPESEPSDVGSFGLGGYIWDGTSSAALSPLVDFSERASFLGTFETSNIFGVRIYGLTGNLLFRFPVKNTSSPVVLEPYVGGGLAFYSISDAQMKGFTVLGGLFVGFEALPQVKFSGGLLHVEMWGEDGLLGAELGGNTLMVGGHYFF
jgi:hypothetical protein